jgi:hypothetical protein
MTYIENRLTELRSKVVQEIVDHLIREVAQQEYSSHGSRSSYAMGCRGLLCRRAHREGMRASQKVTRLPKYAVADAMLEEAEASMTADGGDLKAFMSS